MDQINMSNLVARIDKCNGYSLGNGSEEKDKDIRDEIYRQEQLNNKRQRMTKFDQRVEDQEEDLMVKQLKLFEMLARGEITEDEMYERME